jgi:iron complex transport system ATP-binding protein
MKLATHDLAFGYPERPVGHSVSLSVSPGEVLCLLGPNGCGKTTLFKTMLGLLRAQRGNITFDGDNISALTRPEVARRVAYVPQGSTAPFPYSAVDLVLMGRVAHRGLFAGPTSEDREAADKALSDLGIHALRDRDVNRLSGGQRQLVMIARALAQAAPLIVMDEPTASLDFGNQVTVLQEVRRIAERGAGVILSTHDPNHAFAVATRVALMHDGVLVVTGSPTQVLTAAHLTAVYGVPVTVETLASGRAICSPALGGADIVRAPMEI